MLLQESGKSFSRNFIHTGSFVYIMYIVPSSLQNVPLISSKSLQQQTFHADGHFNCWKQDVNPFALSQHLARSIYTDSADRLSQKT